MGRKRKGGRGMLKRLIRSGREGEGGEKGNGEEWKTERRQDIEKEHN